MNAAQIPSIPRLREPLCSPRIDAKTTPTCYVRKIACSSEMATSTDKRMVRARSEYTQATRIEEKAVMAGKKVE
jgi:hypothetical protein